MEMAGCDDSRGRLCLGRRRMGRGPTDGRTRRRECRAGGRRVGDRVLRSAAVSRIPGTCSRRAWWSACADATSVVSQFGPTHALAESDAALSIVAVGFPVPGTSSFAPALGVGDLVFVAIVFGAVAAHRLSIVRVALLCGLGAAIAGAASAVLGAAVPALVPIAAAVVLGVPEARRLRPRERRVAIVAMVIAASVAAAAIASQLVRYLMGMKQ